MRRRPQVRLLREPRVVPAEALPVLLRQHLLGRGGAEPGRAPRHRPRVSQQELRRHLRVLRLAAQLLLQTVLFRFRRHRLLLWFKRVSGKE